MTMMCKFGTGLRHLQAHWFAAFEHIIADMQSSSEPRPTSYMPTKDRLALHSCA